MRDALFAQHSRTSIARLLGSAVLMMVCAWPAVAASQAASAGVTADDRAGQACLDTLSDASLSRVIVSQRAVLTETNAAVLTQSALISQHIAAAARTALGGVGDSLPAGNELGVWRQSIEHLPLVIVIHKDGPFTWHRDRGGVTTNAKLAAFYERVLHSIPPDSLWMVWPDGYAADSVAMRLDVMSDNPFENAPSMRVTLFPIFTAQGLARTSAAVDVHVDPPYPQDATADSIAGRVVMAVVIGIDGRADSSTIHVDEPSASVLATSPMAHYYREFIDASRAVVMRETFRPARIGGCVIRQVVHLSFDYLPRKKPAGG
jgi:hypothetical protein